MKFWSINHLILPSPQVGWTPFRLPHTIKKHTQAHDVLPIDEHSVWPTVICHHCMDPCGGISLSGNILWDWFLQSHILNYLLMVFLRIHNFGISPRYTNLTRKQKARRVVSENTHLPVEKQWGYLTCHLLENANFSHIRKYHTVLL